MWLFELYISWPISENVNVFILNIVYIASVGLINGFYCKLEMIYNLKCLYTRVASVTFVGMLIVTALIRPKDINPIEQFLSIWESYKVNPWFILY